MEATQDAVLDWLNTGEVGISSKCMAMWLTFGKRVSGPFGNHPHDPDDMDRCLKLLARVPALRERLPKMAEVSKTWAALVERWDEIEAMQMDEIGLNWTKARSAPKTYALMQAVIDGAKKRPNDWFDNTITERQMLHIDDWLDDQTTGPADVKEWLEHFRRPAIEKDHAWLRARQLFCTYKDGKRYRCIGCSRMGDVWLTEHFERENGYDLRIDIADCTDWEVVSNV